MQAFYPVLHFIAKLPRNIFHLPFYMPQHCVYFQCDGAYPRIALLCALHGRRRNLLVKSLHIYLFDKQFWLSNKNAPSHNTFTSLECTHIESIPTLLGQQAPIPLPLLKSCCKRIKKVSDIVHHLLSSSDVSSSSSDESSSSSSSLSKRFSIT